MSTVLQMREARLQRAYRFAALYTEGFTLDAIGQAHDITRERVRQLLAEIGVTGKDGGARVVAAANEARRAAQSVARRNARCIAALGCDHATAVTLNGDVCFYRPGSLTLAFIRQRQNARNRGIGWSLTFPEWFSIWEKSGHLAERGVGRDKFCMARKGDVGPYAAENVYITTIAENGRDYQMKRNRGVRGWRYRPENTRKPYVVHMSKKYIGSFATEAEANAAYLAAKQSS